MKKRFLLLMAILASSAWAQQNTDISAEQFTSGAANSQLSALGRQAASSGKRLVVTAPQHWHAQIAAKIRAGGNADVVLKDGFYETVLVRIEDKVEEPAKPEPRPEPKPAVASKVEPKRTPPPAAVAPSPEPVAEDLPVPPPSRAVVEAPPAAPAAPQVQAPPPAVAPRPATPAPAATVAEQAPASEPPAAPAVNDPTAPVMLVVAEPGDTDAVRIALEKRYNEGKRISERVEVSGLRRADTIYTGNGAAVVVRREGSRLLRMWLIGLLNLNQIGISSEGANKYQVLNSTLK